MYDLIVAGAGPAGCTLALSLAGSGLRIAVIDRDVFPRRKICGDALSGKVLNILKRMPGEIYREFLSDIVKEPSYGIRFVAPNLRELDLPFPSRGEADAEPPGYVCPRSEFDHFLLRKAALCPGVTIFENTKITGAVPLGDSVLVKTTQGDFRSRVIAGADGIHSLVRKMAGIEPSARDHCLGIRSYFENVSGLHPSGFIELIFLRELLPGYLWIFRGTSGICNVGLGLLSSQVTKRRINLNSFLMDLLYKHPYLKSRFSGARLLDKPEAHTLPLGSYSIKRSGNRFLLLGDAAYLVDPFSGEGIGNAMSSGECAAKVLRDCFQRGSFGETDLYAYDEQVERRMGRELRISSVLQKMATSPFLFNYVLGKARKNEELRKMLSGMYTNEELRKKLTKPGFYLKLLLI